VIAWYVDFIETAGFFRAREVDAFDRFAGVLRCRCLHSPCERLKFAQVLVARFPVASLALGRAVVLQLAPATALEWNFALVPAVDAPGRIWCVDVHDGRSGVGISLI
jgi:hypothetical protein